MKHQLLRSILFWVGGFLIHGAFAQDLLRGTLTMGLGNIAEIKQKAEAGDAASQVALGDSLVSRFHPAEGLEWYKEAAMKGHLEAKYLVGKMLLSGAPGIPKTQTVKPSYAEGIKWTFMAATNFHPQACWNMANVYRNGTCMPTNWVTAYAWLLVYADKSPGSIVANSQMNDLALKMDTASLRQAQSLAAKFKAGEWQVPLIHSIPEGDPRLKLNGLSSGTSPCAIINGKTLVPGESAKITIKPGTLTIKCVKIDKDSVTISVEGEEAPRILKLN